MNTSWSSPVNAESAALALYHVVLFVNTSSENFVQLAEAILIATDSQQNASYIYELPSQIQTKNLMYNISISLRAENKCGKMSEEVTAYCNYYASNNEHSIYSSTYHIIIIMYFLFNFIIL